MARHEDIGFKVGIFALFLIGMAQADIARLYDISRQRIGQILDDVMGMLE